MTHVNDALLIVPGVAAAAFGGELFVRGAVGLAARSRIPPGIIGATVAAFGTSSPELSVAVNAATAGHPEISFGDALGSNVVNVGLVLALAILLGGIQARRADLARDIPVALIAPVLAVALGVDGTLSRVDAIVLLVTFAIWVTITVRQAARERSEAEEVLAEHGAGRVLRDILVGLVLLVVAGRLIVLAAKGVGELLGWDTFTVGAVLVAVATSTPELATVIVARLRGHDEVSVGTVLGSNIFNGLLIVGTAALICPIPTGGPELAVAAIAGIVTIVMVIPGRSARLAPPRGLGLLAVYATYLVALLRVHQGP
jgi:cation:H+ antiporter